MPWSRSGSRLGRVVRRLALVGVVVFLLVQLVPYGWRHPNPPVVADAPWPDARSEELARTACYDCHSNETDWPVYSYVAPMSWLVRRDVEDGREELNFSRWDDDAGEADDALDELVEGSMPPDRYVALHRDADLSTTDQATLATALETLARQHDRDDEDDRSGSDSGPG